MLRTISDELTALYKTHQWHVTFQAGMANTSCGRPKVRRVRISRGLGEIQEKLHIILKKMGATWDLNKYSIDTININTHVHTTVIVSTDNVAAIKTVMQHLSKLATVPYGDAAGCNTVEENSSIFSLIQMR